MAEGESTDPEVSSNDTVPVSEATDDPTNNGEVTNFPTMKDETTFQSIAEATTNGSDNVVEDFTSAEILPESSTDLTEDNETTEGQDETVTEETDTTTPFPIQEDNAQDYYYDENITTETQQMKLYLPLIFPSPQTQIQM